MARRRVWLLAVAAIVLLAAAAPTAGLLAILLAPAVGVALLDRSPGRSLSQVAWLYGAAFAVGPVWRLWAVDPGWSPDWGPALAIAADPATLGLAWLGQALGVVVAEGMPLALQVVLDRESTQQATRLRAARARLEAEWGIAPRPDAA